MTRANTLPPGDRADDEYHEAAQALRSVGDQWHLRALNVSAAYSAIIHGRYADAAKLLDETLPLARESNDPWGLLLVWGNVGLVRLLRERTAVHGSPLKSSFEYAAITTSAGLRDKGWAD